MLDKFLLILQYQNNKHPPFLLILAFSLKLYTDRYLKGYRHFCEASIHSTLRSIPTWNSLLVL